MTVNTVDASATAQCLTTAYLDDSIISPSLVERRTG
jgi:hypothetical protein